MEELKGEDRTARNLFALSGLFASVMRIATWVATSIFLAPWLSAGYQFNVHDDVVVSGERFRPEEMQHFFATVHARLAILESGLSSWLVSLAGP